MWDRIFSMRENLIEPAFAGPRARSTWLLCGLSKGVGSFRGLRMSRPKGVEGEVSDGCVGCLTDFKVGCPATARLSAAPTSLISHPLHIQSPESSLY